MGYYMRFFQTDDSELTLSEIEAGLKEKDLAFTIERDTPDSRMGHLMHQGDLYAEIELNPRGQELADEEIAEFRERLEGVTKESVEQVCKVLDTCRCILALRLLHHGFDNLDRIDLIWDWLFLRKEGLMQADSEGFYDEDGLILSVK